MSEEVSLFPRAKKVEQLPRPTRVNISISLYSYCNMPQEYNHKMVVCDECDWWYHCRCEISKDNILENWSCDVCNRTKQLFLCSQNIMFQNSISHTHSISHFLPCPFLLIKLNNYELQWRTHPSAVNKAPVIIYIFISIRPFGLWVAPRYVQT